MGSRRELPFWALPATIIACVVVLALIVWRVFFGSTEVGPPKEVHPGMYDFRAEIQKMRAAKEQQKGTQSNGK